MCAIIAAFTSSMMAELVAMESITGGNHSLVLSQRPATRGYEHTIWRNVARIARTRMASLLYGCVDAASDVQVDEMRCHTPSTECEL